MMSPHDIYASIERNIARSGQHLFLVFGDEHMPAFAYTIGNALLGLPELLLIGNFPPQVAGSIVNDLGRRMRAARRPLTATLTWAAAFRCASGRRRRRRSAASRSRRGVISATRNMTCSRSCSAIQTASIQGRWAASQAMMCRSPDRHHFPNAYRRFP